MENNKHSGRYPWNEHHPSFGDIYFKESNKFVYIYISEEAGNINLTAFSDSHGDRVNLTSFSDSHGGLHAVDRKVHKTNFEKKYIYTGVNVSSALFEIMSTMNEVKERCIEYLKLLEEGGNDE